MKLNKIKITSEIAHFKIPHGSKNQRTYLCPPLSTVFGMLRVIYGEDINDFVFGYTFKYSVIKNDGITIYKVNKDVKKNKKGYVTDYCHRGYLYDCELIIYTDIDNKILLQESLNMGKSNCLARVYFPIKKVDLINKKGICYNQYSPKEIGTGIIMPITFNSKFNHKLGCFDTKILHLRYNEQFEYQKYHDKELNENVFLWKYEDGEVNVY